MQNSTKPVYPPQILLDQFQRPVAPVPGITLFEHFTLEIYKVITTGTGGSFVAHRTNIHRALDIAQELLKRINEIQAETTLQAFEKPGNNETSIIQ